MNKLDYKRTPGYLEGDSPADCLAHLIGLSADLETDIKHKLTLLGLVNTILKDKNYDSNIIKSLGFSAKLRKPIQDLAIVQMEETLFLSDASAAVAFDHLRIAFDFCEVFTDDLEKHRSQRENTEKWWDELDAIDESYQQYQTSKLGY